LVAQEFVAESLVEDLLKVTKPGARVLIPRASEAREILPEALRRANLEVRVVAAYQTSHVTGEAAELLKRQIKEDAEIILFTASSMVDAVVQALGSDAPDTLRERTLASIGPITSATLRKHGFQPSVEARVFTVEGLLDSLEEAVESPD
jgi:uroporphyrinogen III methyltransferase/synthase